MPTPPRARTSVRPHNSSVRVLSVPDVVPVTVRFLAGYLGLDTHFRSGRSFPCDGPGVCPATVHRTGIIWKGYAPVEAWEDVGRLWRPWVLEVTESLEEIIRGRELRGEVWNLYRVQRNGRTDPVTGVYCERIPESKLSPAFDVKPVLLRLFHVSDLRLGQSNPLPPQLVLQAVAGDAPNLPAELQRLADPASDQERLEEAKRVHEQLRNRQERWKQMDRAAGVGQPEQNGKHHSNNGH